MNPQAIERTTKEDCERKHTALNRILTGLLLGVVILFISWESRLTKQEGRTDTNRELMLRIEKKIDANTARLELMMMSNPKTKEMTHRP